jgi:tRNA U38,U39,U40 pseudouridine synthase TruA
MNRCTLCQVSFLNYFVAPSGTSHTELEDINEIRSKKYVGADDFAEFARLDLQSKSQPSQRISSLDRSIEGAKIRSIGFSSLRFRTRPQKPQRHKRETDRRYCFQKTGGQ